MNISELTLRLILLFLPGIICCYIVDALTVHRPQDKFFFIIKAVFFALLSYATYWGALRFAGMICASHSYSFTFLTALRDAAATLDYAEVFRVCVVAVILAFLVSALLNHKALHKFARKLRVSKKTAELDIWAFLMNSDIAGWAIVRFFESDLIYKGWVTAYSDDGVKKELLLTKVTVFKNTSGERLYSTDAVYIDCAKERCAIEFPKASSSTDETEEKKHGK